MIKQMDMEFMFMWMVLNMKANGKTINSMEKVLKFGRMALNLKVLILMGKKMGMVNLNGQMEIRTLEIFKTIILKAKENTNDLMGESIMASEK